MIAKGKKMARKDLSLAEKIALIEEIQNQPANTSHRQLAQITGVPKSTIGRVLQQKEKLQEKWELTDGHQGGSQKRERKRKAPEVDNPLYLWYSTAIQQGEYVTGAVLKRKAEELAKLFGHEDFKATDGWLFRWKRKFGVRLKKTEGETGYDYLDTQDKNCVGMFQKTEINSGNEVEDSNNLENCFAFVNVNQIKTENDDQLDIHDEPIQTFSQHSSDTYSETMENSFYLGGKRENSVSPSASQEPEQKKIKNSFMERTDEIISVINRLEKVLISETNRRQEGDLFDVFGRSVSDQLRQLPRRQAIMAQSKIQNLLIQEFLEYENLNTSKTHE
ncbi:Tigger transposable element-derived protein 3 [Armadillidium vulgare]|nr:Tigger transposable element-derived protein 3 [Armadillidium vulgare]